MKLNVGACYGCGGCVQACPADCLHMEPDAEGFLYPVRDASRCNACGRCEAVCPIGLPISLPKQPELLAAVHREEAVVRASASGGAFSAIAQGWAGADGAVFGACWSEDGRTVRHRGVGLDDLAELRKSKYLQSDMGECYVACRELLEAGKRVVFSGTPCQIAGLTRFLGHPYDQLLTVDLTCHGVPNAWLFGLYLDEVEAHYRRRVLHYTFRHKSCRCGEWDSRSALVELEGGREVVSTPDQSDYLRGYYESLFLRRSCDGCRCAVGGWASDITIADFWRIQKQLPQLNPDRGVSRIRLNTPKAQAFREALEPLMALYPVVVDPAKLNEWKNRLTPVAHANRASFFERLENGEGFGRAVRRFVPRLSLSKRIGRALLGRWGVRQLMRLAGRR